MSKYLIVSMISNIVVQLPYYPALVFYANIKKHVNCYLFKFNCEIIIVFKVIAIQLVLAHLLQDLKLLNIYLLTHSHCQVIVIAICSHFRFETSHWCFQLWVHCLWKQKYILYNSWELQRPGENSSNSPHFTTFL